MGLVQIDCFQKAWNLKLRYSCISREAIFILWYLSLRFCGASVSFKSGWALHQHSQLGEPYNISMLTSSCAAYCFLFPLLIQMTLIWTISVEHQPTDYLLSQRELIWVWKRKLNALYYTSCNIYCMFSTVVSCFIHVAILIYENGATCLLKLELVRVKVCVISPW